MAFFKIIEALPFPRSSTLHSLVGQAVATSPPSELPRAASQDIPEGLPVHSERVSTELAETDSEGPPTELSEGPPTEHAETDSEELPTEHSLEPPTAHSETLPTNQLTTSGHSEPPNTEETSGLPSGTEQVDCHNGGGAGNSDPVDVNTGGDGSSGDGSADDGRLPPSPPGSEVYHTPLFTPMERYNFMYKGTLREEMLFHGSEERFPHGARELTTSRTLISPRL